ncbi:carboxylesterase/lipase family protein [Actinomadura flavalba]|uniref:carboxylesterase/lipase family protein n=1 Tax=Actinomadura flavalba TaxID=1120938 RepID=UPI00035D0E6D|nr:carboxylesterase family protein [Actinomadura flavalba]
MFSRLRTRLRRRSPRTAAVTAISAACLPLAAFGAGAVAVPAAAAAPASGQAVVRTDRGPVRGLLTADRRDFLGIPYAAPPVGALRWASPVQHARWSAPRDATRPGPICAQLELPPSVAGEAEDCLFLNVTTPRRPAARKLPVIVFLHGGGFSAGAGTETRATELASRGQAVVVTINYRLGVFGFLAHPALDGGAARMRSGNFGLEDQQHALRWVRRNAAAFGGDAGNVTLSGQWSGGKGVCVQMTSPSAAGLFQRAITMSNPCLLHRVPEADGSYDPTPLGMPRPRAEAEAQGRELAAELGCTDARKVAACLRAKPTKLLLDTAEPLTYNPVHGGGGVLPGDPIKAFREGRVHRVPLLMGVNRDAYRTSEAFLEVWGFGKLTPEKYVERVHNFVGPERAAEVLRRYPLDKYEAPSVAWSALTTDALLVRPMLDTTRALARVLPVYGYEFADRTAPWYSNVDEPSFSTGAYQDAELQYLFATEFFEGRVLNPAQLKLSRSMIGYFTRFAARGNPNAPGLPAWPAANRHPDRAQVLATGHGGIRSADIGRAHQYDFWRTVDY